MGSFHRYATGLTYRHARVLAGAAGVWVLALWPFDAVLYGPEAPVERALGLWRAGTLGAVVGAALLLGLLSRRGRDPFVLLAITITACAALRGHAISVAGGIEQPFFHTGNFIPLVTIPMIWSLGRRFAATVAITAAYPIAYFATTPGRLDHPAVGQVLAFVGFSALLSLAIGHTLYRLLRDNHHQRRALDEMNERLEAQVAARTEQLRRLASHIETRREEERRRLAREIHDESGQLLTALRMEVDQARAQRDDDARQQVLDRMDELVVQALAATRALVAELRPRVLDDLGLAAAAEWYLERFAERSGLQCDWAVELNGAEIDDPRSVAVFRIMQESLTNVARHARADNVRVALRLRDGAITLDVHDDGVGPGDSESRAEGFGVLGMRERARDLGGILEVAQSEPRGTRVRLRLPLGGQEATAMEQRA